MQTAPRRFACTAASHALTKSSRHSFRRDTTPLGLLADGEGGQLEIANCKLCHTTLAIPAETTPDQREAAAAFARREWREGHE